MLFDTRLLHMSKTPAASQTHAKRNVSWRAFTLQRISRFRKAKALLGLEKAHEASVIVQQLAADMLDNEDVQLLFNYFDQAYGPVQIGDPSKLPTQAKCVSERCFAIARSRR